MDVPGSPIFVDVTFNQGAIGAFTNHVGVDVVS